MKKNIKRRRSNISTEDIVLDFKIVHGNKYDYSLVKYLKMHSKVIIICREHGKFSQSPNSHKRGKGCRKCSRAMQTLSQKGTTDTFIQKAINIHGNRYNYSKAIYGETAHEKVTVLCREHGEFRITPNSHLSKKTGCSLCGRVSAARKLKEFNTGGWTKTHFVEKFAGRTAKLYIIKCFNENEEFYKIGMTTVTVHKRFTKNKIPYEYEILKIIKSKNIGYIYDLEKLILRTTKDFKYRPKISFAGETECRSNLSNIFEVY